MKDCKNLIGHLPAVTEIVPTVELITRQPNRCAVVIKMKTGKICFS